MPEQAGTFEIAGVVMRLDYPPEQILEALSNLQFDDGIVDSNGNIWDHPSAVDESHGMTIDELLGEIDETHDGLGSASTHDSDGRSKAPTSRTYRQATTDPGDEPTVNNHPIPLVEDSSPTHP